MCPQVSCLVGGRRLTRAGLDGGKAVSEPPSAVFDGGVIGSPSVELDGRVETIFHEPHWKLIQQSKGENLYGTRKIY